MCSANNQSVARRCASAVPATARRINKTGALQRSCLAARVPALGPPPCVSWRETPQKPLLPPAWTICDVPRVTDAEAPVCADACHCQGPCYCRFPKLCLTAMRHAAGVADMPRQRRDCLLERYACDQLRPEACQASPNSPSSRQRHCRSRSAIKPFAVQHTSCFGLLLPHCVR